jgi:outer membrane receptor protein involved in Fe transport
MNFESKFLKENMYKPSKRRRTFGATMVSAIALLTASYTANAEEFTFNIASQSTNNALMKLADAAKVQIVFSPDAVNKIRSPAIQGTHSLEDALDKALGKTGLTYEFKSDNFVVIKDKGVSSHKPSQSYNDEQGSGRLMLANLQTTSNQPSSRQAAVSSSSEMDSDEIAIDTIVVTGSRLVNANVASSSAVTVLDAKEFDVRGVTRVEDLINILPQALSGQTSASGVNGAQATVNLRGLGANRTLVLVDGKRLPYGSPINAAADLNQIPAQLVERVEVLTGGATAVYGADAVAGVVNFKMIRDFEGVEMNAQTSVFQAGNNNSAVESVLADFGQPDPDGVVDGLTLDFSLVAGSNFADGRGNITAYFGYSKDNEVRWEDRDYTSCPFGTRNGGEDFSCSGSGSQPRLTLFSRTGEGGFNLVQDETTGLLRNYDSSTDAFNFALGNYLQRPRERFTYGAFTRYELNDNIELFFDFSVADNTTDAQIAAGGLALGRTSDINCDNPLLNGEMLSTFCDPSVTFTDNDGIERAPLRIGRRNLENPRNAQFQLTTQRFLGGLRGEVLDGFNYEVFGQYSKVNYSEMITNDVSVSRVTRAIDVVTDPATGLPVCRSVLTGEDPDCIPFDIFTAGGITQEASDYVAVPSLRVGDTEQFIVGGSLAGGLGFVSPTAADEAQFAVGFEYREDSLSLTPDSSDTTTNARVPVSGSVKVFELFGEVNVPLVQDVAMFEDLSVNAAYRYSDYFETTGTQGTYSFGLSWQPISDLRIRGQYQRATRSPNPIELFNPQEFGLITLSSGLNGLGDPCAGDFDAATSTPEPERSFEECALTGVTSSQYGTILDSSGNFNSQVGGNPDLEPELSDTWTLGVILTPSAVPGLTVSLDYFSIKVDGFIGTVPAQFALNECLETGDELYCDLINRDSAGTLFLVNEEAFIQGTNINTGTLKTSGIDINANYSFDMDSLGLANGGEMRVTYIATILKELEEETLPGETPFDCAGFYSGACGNPTPEYRHRVNFAWSKDKVSATLGWRYISSVSQYGTTTTAVNETLEAVNYFDLSGSYNITDDLQIRGGINNVLDQDPPLTSLAGFGGSEDSGRGNTYPQIYDAQGRFIFAGVTVAF